MYDDDMYDDDMYVYKYVYIYTVIEKYVAQSLHMTWTLY